MNMDRIIETIELNIEYDVLNWSEFKIDITNRYGWNDEVITIQIYNNSAEEIINKIKNL